LENTEENCEMIWKIWMKCEMIWKIWKKSKMYSEKMGKYGRNQNPEQQQPPPPTPQ
jgi:hypothetical protein